MSRLAWLTATVLQATGANEARAATWLPHVLQACEAYDIDTPARVAAFLAQIGHESGGLRYVSEIWGPTDAQRRYEGRLDLGNTQPGDGSRFRGHGLIQITGRANHAAVRDGLRERLFEAPDFEQEPEALTEPQWAALSAAWYWHSRKLNALADAGDFEAITRRINGGLNGQADRAKRWGDAKFSIARAMVASTPSVEAPIPTPVPEPAPLPAPAPEAPAIPSRPVPAEEAVNMSPFVAAALTAILDAVPKLGKMFGSGSEVAERNVKAVETIVGVAKSAIGAANEQDLVERLKTDPSALQAVRKAVEDQWYALTEVGGGIAAAREADQQYLQPDAKPFWHAPSIWITAALLPLVYFVVVRVLTAGKEVFSQDIQAMVIASVISGVLGAIVGFWLGTSHSSQRKTELSGK